MVGPPDFDISSGRPQIDKVVLKRAAFRGASIGLAAVISGAIHREHDALLHGVDAGLLTGISSAFMVAVVPSAESWVDKLPDRHFEGGGAFLVLIGSLIQTAQYLFPLGVLRAF